MAPRVDAIQVALPRAVIDAQQQQHVAARQPVVAQEQLAAAHRQTAQERELRAQAVERRLGVRTENDLLPGVLVREDREGRGAPPGRRREGVSGRRRPATLEAAAPVPAAGEAASPPQPSPDDRGNRVDLRL